MRIGVIGPNWVDSFASNISDGLSSMGHDPVALDLSFPKGHSYSSAITGFARHTLPSLDELMQRRIARVALENECELIINIDQRLMPSVVRLLQRSGLKVALWFPDAISGMGRQFMLLAPYDVVFVKDPYLVERLRAVLDLPIFYLPEACNPRLHRPIVAPGTEPHLVIAGNMYPSRVLLLERLLAKGVPLKLYGTGFPRWTGQTSLREVHTGRPVFGEEKARIFRSAVAVLNNIHPAEIEGVNARLFEATGSGAAVLTEFRTALPDLFVIGSEVLAFRDFDELLDQATRLLSEYGLSARLGTAAARRAHENHTYERRLPIILEKLC